MSDWTSEAVQVALQEVARKSAIDPEFRKLCLSDPIAALAQVSEIRLPPNFKIRIVENQGANVTLVLPDPEFENEELQESDLELISGGITITLETLPYDWNKLNPLSTAPKSKSTR